MTKTAENQSPDRRDFLRVCVAAGLTALTVGAPLGAYVVAPSLKKGVGKWIDFGSAADLAAEGMTLLTYEFMVKDGWQVLPQRGFVWAKSEPESKLTVFSSTCTHLACSVVWREEMDVFECPCHSGRFDSDGRPIAGPPSKPMQILKHKIENGNVLVFLTV